MCEMQELDSLEQEMASLLVQDETYWRQNDAKFRAVAQNVSYEQFEEIGRADLFDIFLHTVPCPYEMNSQIG